MVEAAFGIGTLTDGEPHALGRAEMERGVLVRGGGGTGKTSVLLSLFGSAVRAGGGCVLVDGKADARTLAAALADAGAAGRLADVVHLDLAGDDPDRATATCNPFAWMSGREMADLVLPAYDGIGRVPANAVLVVGAVARALAHLRDRGLVDLDARAVRDHLSLRRVTDLADGNKYPDMPREIAADLRAGLATIPGFHPERGYRQVDGAIAAFGNAVSHAMTALDAMCAEDAVFGHAVGDLDTRDLASGARIAVLTLPPAGTSRAAALACVAYRLLSHVAGVVASDPRGRDVPVAILLDEALAHHRDAAEVMLSRCGVGGVAVAASSRAGLDGQGWSFAGGRVSLPGDDGLAREGRSGDIDKPCAGEYRYVLSGHVVAGRIVRHVSDGPVALPVTVGVDMAYFAARMGEDPFDDLAPGEVEFPPAALGAFPEASSRVDAHDAVRRAVAAACDVGGAVRAAADLDGFPSRPPGDDPDPGAFPSEDDMIPPPPGDDPFPSPRPYPAPAEGRRVGYPKGGRHDG